MLTDRKGIADALQDQFCSFSNPHDSAKKVPTNQTPSKVLPDITFLMEDTIKAIDEIDINSSCPDFSIPAIVLKKCKQVLCKPLYTMWKESLDCGVVPALYKQQLVTPMHK